MKKIIIILFLMSILSCYGEPGTYYPPSKPYCIYDVYQSATIIDNECKLCDLDDHEGGSVYFINTDIQCNPNNY